VKSVPVLRALSPDGAVLWSRQFAEGPNSTFVMGLAAATDQSALALIGPRGGEKSGAVFALARIDKSGTEVASLPLAIAGDTRSDLWGHLAVNKDAGLAVISRSAHPTTQAQGFDWLGRPRFCFDGDAAEIFLVDLSRLKEERRLRIDRFRAHSALALGDGWLLVGEARDDCALDKHAAAYRVNADGSVVPLWRDASPFDTFARGVRSTGDAIEIVGFTNDRSPCAKRSPPSPCPISAASAGVTRPMFRARSFPSASHNKASRSGQTLLPRAFRWFPLAWSRPRIVARSSGRLRRELFGCRTSGANVERTISTKAMVEQKSL